MGSLAYFERAKQEEVLVYYAGKEVFLSTEKHRNKQFVEEKHIFTIVALLTECEEGTPEIGDVERVSEEDMKDMANHGVYFREATATELVLYATSR